MLDDRIIDLVQRDIDRENDDAERRELHQRLERDPDARIYSDEMVLMTTLLARISPDDPPSDFTAAVMKRVRAHTADGSANNAPVHRTQFQRRGRQSLRFAFALAAAAAIAFLLAPSLFHSLRPDQLRGSMIPPAAGTERTWTIAAGPECSIEVKTTGKQVSLQFHVPSGSAGDAKLSFDETALELRAVEGTTHQGTEPGRIMISFNGSRPVVRLDRNSGRAVALSVEMQLTKQTNYRTRIEIPASTNFRQ